MRKWIAGAASMVAPHVVSARRDRVVFTAFHGRGYRGNPRAMFERLVATGALDPVWLCADRSLATDLVRRFTAGRAAFVHSAAGVRAVAEARALVLSHGVTDLELIRLPRRAVVLQSWHGLPTKRGELMDAPSVRARVATWRAWRAVTHLLSSSPFVSDVYRARFGVPRRALLELGYPSHDALIRGPSLDTAAVFSHAPSHGPVILYAPTFRTRAPTRWFPFRDFSPGALADALERRNALLLLRPHPNERVDLRALASASPRIQLADDRAVEDPFSLLRRADVVVTDYSAVYLEGLLCDTPCVFVPYDLATYERGIAWDYRAMTPGPHAHTFGDWVDAIDDALDRPGAHAAARARVRDTFFSHTDGRATDRVVQWLSDAVRE